MDARWQIRDATRADVPAIHAIETRVFADPWSVAAITAAIADIALVAETNSAIVGYVMARAVADQGEILNLAVARGTRRSGVGTALVSVAVRRMAVLGARHVFLEVRESAVAARALYVKAGFAAVGRRPKYYKNPTEDAIMMRCGVPATDVSH